MCSCYPPSPWHQNISRGHHTFSIFKKSLIRITFQQNEQGVPSRTHKAYFPTALISSPTDLFCYDYYCYFIAFYLWRTCYLNMKSVYGTDTINLSHITSKILTVAKFVTVDIQNNISHTHCVRMFMIYLSTTFHVPVSNGSLVIAHKP
jgi:hypothetical protein